MFSLTSPAWEIIQERTRVAVGEDVGVASDPLANECRASFRTFVREFWEMVPGAGTLIWNWHIGVLCDEMQRGAERVFRGEPCEDDEVINVVFGTSKSTVCSILFHPWTWTRMPEARHLTATHTETLALDLANKSRAVVRSEKYHDLFPEIVLRSDTDAKSYQMNTRGGVRQAFTVSGKNPMGFHFHFLGCLPWESRIITDKGLLSIGRIVEDRLPVNVLGYSHDDGQVCWQKIESYQINPVRPLGRITFVDGTQLEATAEHPVFVVKKGYVGFGEVVKGDEVIHALSLQAVLTQVQYDEEKDQKAGTLTLFSLRREMTGRRMTAGRPPRRLRREQLRQAEYDGPWSGSSCKVPHEVPPQAAQIRTKVVSFVERAVRVPKAVYNLGVAETHNYFAEGILVHNCDDPLDPQSAISDVELLAAREFMSTSLPSRKVDKLVSWTFLIMQRLRRGDPSDVMVEIAKREGARPVRRLCLPGELSDDVYPPQLKANYVDSLLDPVRLPRAVLKEYWARLGSYSYSAQVMQNPAVRGGGMFRDTYFVQRVKAAPYDCVRVRFWDRAACLIAGTQIQTINGSVRIEDVRAGELVKTRNGFKRVLWSGVSGFVNELASVLFSNGSVVTGTVDHPVWDECFGWVDLATLDGSSYTMGLTKREKWEDPETQNLSRSFIRASTIAAIRAKSISRPCGEVLFEKRAGPILCTAPFGDIISVISPVAAKYITRTVIGITTNLKIFNASHLGNTIGFTGFSNDGTRPKKQRSIERNVEGWDGGLLREPELTGACIARKRGAAPRLELPQSFVRMGSAEIGTKQERGQRCARFAGDRFGGVPEPALVRTTARISIGEAFAVSAENFLLRRESLKSFAPKGVGPNGSIPVYDLCVEDDHEFFANGILVHNTQDGGCATAGVLIARAKDGGFFVEHVVHGQWEPFERNAKILAAAQRDRSRYGAYEPLVVIEAERGSTGEESYKNLARQLAGFRVREDRPTGSKDVRAEPWSDQCAAGNVKLVDDGTWDVTGYVEEHCLFMPDQSVKRLGKWKDRVDASSGAFLALTSGRSKPAEIKVYKIGDDRSKRTGPRIVAGSFVDLAGAVSSLRALLVIVKDPGEDDALPEHGFSTLLGHVMVRFADLDPKDLQDRWREPLPPWNELPERLVMNRQDVKKVWALLLRKRDPQAEIWAFADSTDGRRAASLACAVAEVTGRKKEEVTLLRPDMDLGNLNRHVVDLIKTCRSMVVS